MKIKDGFVLRDVAGQTIVVAVGQMSKTFNGLIKLNSTGKFLWEHLQKDTDKDELISSLLSEYDVDHAVAAADTDKFLSVLEGAGILEK